MTGVKTPFIFRFFDEKYLAYRIPSESKRLYLTFDDGPVPDITPEVLKILRQRRVKATFFCVGENVSRYKDIYNGVVEEGHLPGNHTYNHLNGWKTPPGEYVENVNRCKDLFRATLFRPPYGRFTPSQYYLLRKEYRFILWSVLTGDYSSGVSKEKCLDNATRYSSPGSIIVFHDSLKAKEKLFYALPRFIDASLEKGYEFGLIPI
jgi:peptidoglycan-N-acetylglucosamine deacetylase